MKQKHDVKARMTHERFRNNFIQWEPKILLKLKCKRWDTLQRINIEKEVTRIVRE